MDLVRLAQINMNAVDAKMRNARIKSYVDRARNRASLAEASSATLNCEPGDASPNAQRQTHGKITTFTFRQQLVGHHKLRRGREIGSHA